jgi:hypothetical protein
MDWLERAGYQAVTLEQSEQAWFHNGTPPPRPVVLIFDDGYRPQFTYALPELRRHGWAGVLSLKAEGSDLYSSNVEAMIAAVRAAGYAGATTEVPGYAGRGRPYELARFEVRRSTGVEGVAADLRSG